MGTEKQPTAIVVDDFNRDGRLDIATANEASGQNDVSILLQTDSKNLELSECWNSRCATAAASPASVGKSIKPKPSPPHDASFLRDKHSKLWHSVVVTVLSNTHRLITRIQECGFTEEQAEGITDVVQEIDLAEVTTKGDLLQLELKLERQIADAKIEILKWVVPLMLGQLASFSVIVKWMVG